MSGKLSEVLLVTIPLEALKLGPFRLSTYFSICKWWSCKAGCMYIITIHGPFSKGTSFSQLVSFS